MSEQPTLPTSPHPNTPTSSPLPHTPTSSYLPPSAPPPGEPPREVTARVSGRSWAEPQVRFWWMAALAIGIGAVYLAGTEFLEWRQSAWLIHHGTHVMATVFVANSDFVRDHKQPGDSEVILDFDWQGQSQRVKGRLEGRDADQRIIIKSQIPIIIDPQDPTRWTARQAPAPLAAQLASSAAVLAAALVVLVVSALVRRPVLNTWRLGTAAEAVVLARNQAALAPRSWALRCTLAEGDDKRVFTVYVPAEVPCEPGQALWVLTPPGGAAAGRPLAAAWFE